jgi:peroxiredoxin Q/BCP
MLQVGDAAPAFTLADASGNTVSLTDLVATGPIVLYFYPADFTPVCTAQACMFRDWTHDLAEAGIRVVGVSPQDAASKQKFSQKHTLGFTLLADPDKRAIRAYGAAFLFGLVTRRVTYLVEPSPAGPIIADRVVADLSVGPHRAFVTRVLARHAPAAP